MAAEFGRRQLEAEAARLSQVMLLGSEDELLAALPHFVHHVHRLGVTHGSPLSNLVRALTGRLEDALGDLVEARSMQVGRTDAVREVSVEPSARDDAALEKEVRLLREDLHHASEVAAQEEGSHWLTAEFAGRWMAADKGHKAARRRLRKESAKAKQLEAEIGWLRERVADVEEQHEERRRETEKLRQDAAEQKEKRHTLSEELRLSQGIAVSSAIRLQEADRDLQELEAELKQLRAFSGVDHKPVLESPPQLSVTAPTGVVPSVLLEKEGVPTSPVDPAKVLHESADELCRKRTDRVLRMWDFLTDADRTIIESDCWAGLASLAVSKLAAASATGDRLAVSAAKEAADSIEAALAASSARCAFAEWGSQPLLPQPALPVPRHLNSVEGMRAVAGRLSSEWRQKHGDVVDELVVNLNTTLLIAASFAERLAEAAGALNLAEALVLWVATSPSAAVAEISQRPRAEDSQDCIAWVIAAALRGAAAGNETAWATCRKWVKTIGVLLAATHTSYAPSVLYRVLSRGSGASEAATRTLLCWPEAAECTDGAVSADAGSVVYEVRAPRSVAIPRRAVTLLPPLTHMQVDRVATAGGSPCLHCAVEDSVASADWLLECSSAAAAASARLRSAVRWTREVSHRAREAVVALSATIPSRQVPAPAPRGQQAEAPTSAGGWDPADSVRGPLSVKFPDSSEWQPRYCVADPHGVRFYGNVEVVRVGGVAAEGMSFTAGGGSLRMHCSPDPPEAQFTWRTDRGVDMQLQLRHDQRRDVDGSWPEWDRFLRHFVKEGRAAVRRGSAV